MVKNNKLESVYFFSFILKNAPSRNNAEFKQKVEPELRSIIGKRRYVKAEDFYRVVQSLNMDIDDLCKKIFKDNSFNLLYQVVESESKLNELVFLLTKDINEISLAAQIESSRFTRLLNNEFKHLYPNEVNSLALSLRLKPSQLFHYFYGDSGRPRISF